MKTLKISGFNCSRGEDQLIIYNHGGNTTGTNVYGCEAVVGADGIVISVGGNDKMIPVGGFVVSAHGVMAGEIKKELVPGTWVSPSMEFMHIEYELSEAATEKLFVQKSEQVKKRLDTVSSELSAAQTANVNSLLEKAAAEAKEGRYDAASETLDMAYCYTAESRKDEIRAVWHRPREHSDAEVDAYVKRFADAGFNLMLIETNYEGYCNALKCRYDFLPIRKGYENFDVIQSYIDAGKRHGVKIHAWVENFFFGVQGAGCPMADMHPELMARDRKGGMLLDGYDTFYFLNPALESNRQLLLDMYRDILQSYDFDGIQLDYIRYPVIKDIDHTAGFEPQTIELFKSETGIDLREIESIGDPRWEKFCYWCAAHITDYVGKVRSMVDELNEKDGRHIEMSTAIFGERHKAIMFKCQDWCTWADNGWLDFVSPMAYFADPEDIYKEVAHMVEHYGKAPNVAGISPMYNRMPIVETTKQVEACRRAGASGVAFFEATACTDKQIEVLTNGAFRNR